MYLEQIPDRILPSQRVKIKYDCEGGFAKCGTIATPIYKVAKKNADAHGGKHICASCQKRANNPAKRPEVQAKIQKTCLERYGTTVAMNQQEHIEKRKKLFEDEEYKKQWLEKHKQTSLERYGVEHPMQTDAAKKKQKSTMNEKYGVDHPYQSPEIMAKMKANNMKKYGVENVGQLEDVQVKMAKTMLDKYGVEHYNQLPAMKDYLRENCAVWLAESYANPWNAGITRPEEWKQKQRETVADLIERGEWKSGGKTYKGWYNSLKCRRTHPMYRSGYELKVHFHLDDCDDVEFYDYEPFQMPYEDTEGKQRHYTVDFIVRYKSGRTLLIEVKNNYSKEEFLNNGKYKAIKELCSQYGMDLEIWTNEKIASLGYDLKVLLEHERVEAINKTCVD
jgi:hypothetical protein